MEVVTNVWQQKPCATITVHKLIFIFRNMWLQLQTKSKKNMPHINSSTLLVDMHTEKQAETILKATCICEFLQGASYYRLPGCVDA
jgi:hypothetical protein